MPQTQPQLNFGYPILQQHLDSTTTHQHTVLKYIYHIIIVKAGQAGKGMTMQDIPVE